MCSIKIIFEDVLLSQLILVIKNYYFLGYLMTTKDVIHNHKSTKSSNLLGCYSDPPFQSNFQKISCTSNKNRSTLLQKIILNK